MPDTDEADHAAKEDEKGEAGEASYVASAFAKSLSLGTCRKVLSVIPSNDELLETAQPCADGKMREDVEASEEVEDIKSLTMRSRAVESSIQHSPFKKQKTNPLISHNVACLPPTSHDSGYSHADAFSAFTFGDCDAIMEHIQADKATMLCFLDRPDLLFGEELRTQHGLQTYKAYAVTKEGKCVTLTGWGETAKVSHNNLQKEMSVGYAFVAFTIVTLWKVSAGQRHAFLGISRNCAICPESAESADLGEEAGVPHFDQDLVALSTLENKTLHFAKLCVHDEQLFELGNGRISARCVIWLKDPQGHIAETTVWGHHALAERKWAPQSQTYLFGLQVNRQKTCFTVNDDAAVTIVGNEDGYATRCAFITLPETRLHFFFPRDFAMIKLFTCVN